MNHLTAGRYWSVLLTYVLGGLTLGLADQQLGRLSQQVGGKPGLATAVSVNIVLPALAIALAAFHRRLGTAWFGAVVMTVAYTLGLAVVYPRGHGWDIPALLRSVPPVLVVACLGYAVLGTLSVLATRGVRGSEMFTPWG